MEYFARAGIKAEIYIRRILLPSLTLSVVLVFLIYFILIPKLIFLGKFIYLLMIAPVLIAISGILYPKIVADKKKQEIENNLHYYITHLGVLSLSEVDRKEVIKIISERREYKSLAKETEKIYVIIDKWGRSLAQACRFLSKRTSSRIFADFLDRFAHSLDSGEDMDEFLKKEQEVVMNDYATMYKGKIYDMDVFKEIYTSIILSIAFFASFAIIIPFITGESLKTLSFLIVFVLISTEIAIVYFMKNKVPEDTIWHTLDVITDTDRMLIRKFLISIAGCISSGLIYYFLIFQRLNFSLPLPFAVSITITPLLHAGIAARNEEEKIKRKDANFPGFIRSLGGSASARGRQILESLKYLTAHDFGPLTEDIRKLYRRLVTRLNNEEAWRMFSLDTGSNLITRFIDMFVEAIKLGGEPKDVADIIANNFSKMNELRTQRFQSTSSYIGISYGMVVGVAFALFISFGIAKGINEMYLSINVSAEFVKDIIYTTPSENLNWVFNLIYFSLIVHSALSSISIRIMDGGHLLNSLNHFVGMMWITAIVVYLGEKVMLGMLTPGGV